MTFDEFSASPSVREKMALFSAKRKRSYAAYLKAEEWYEQTKNVETQ